MNTQYSTLARRHHLPIISRSKQASHSNNEEIYDVTFHRSCRGAHSLLCILRGYTFCQVWVPLMSKWIMYTIDLVWPNFLMYGAIITMFTCDHGTTVSRWGQALGSVMCSILLVATSDVTSRFRWAHCYAFSVRLARNFSISYVIFVWMNSV